MELDKWQQKDLKNLLTKHNGLIKVSVFEDNKFHIKDLFFNNTKHFYMKLLKKNYVLTGVGSDEIYVNYDVNYNFTMQIQTFQFDDNISFE